LVSIVAVTSYSAKPGVDLRSSARRVLELSERSMLNQPLFSLRRAKMHVSVFGTQGPFAQFDVNGKGNVKQFNKGTVQ
jgi:hypothetical protein